jgi:predicted phosphate transport protein (TIGR00153 family)
MFAWFQRLLPKSGDFYELFEGHGATIVAAAIALDGLARGQGDPHVAIATIRDREHDADDIIRKTLTEVRQTFLAPFDRGAITSLIGAMDDVIDEMQSAASAVELYEFSAFDPHMQEIAGIALTASNIIAEALPMLRDLEKNGERLHKLTGELVSLEGKVDLLHDAGMKEHYQRARGGGKTLDFIVAKEIYKHLERIADAFEDVANEIDSLVIDHA